MTECVFFLQNNQLTTVSGADAGTYMITNNKADIVIDGTTSTIAPFNNTSTLNCTDNVLTIEI